MIPRSSYSGTTIAAEESPEDLNIPCERRRELLRELGKALGVDKVPAPFWACLQVCDLGQVEVIVANARHNPWFVSSFAKHCSHQMPLLWLQEPQEPDDDSASSIALLDMTPEIRDRDIHFTEALERDGNLCVIRRCRPVITALIYPDFRQKYPHAAIFWDLLSIFWPPERLNRWKELILNDPDNPTKVTYACYNSLCMSLEVHRMWRMGMFALRPLEYNAAMTELEVEWYWQPEQEHGITDSVPLSKLPLSSAGLVSPRTEPGYFVFVMTELSSEVVRRVKTGDRFIIKTKDPERLPLPSKDLLDLQFHLQRMASMAGAAGVDRLGWGYYDETPSTYSLQGSYAEQWLESCVSAGNGERQGQATHIQTSFQFTLTFSLSVGQKSWNGIFFLMLTPYFSNATLTMVLPSLEIGEIHSIKELLKP